MSCTGAVLHVDVLQLVDDRAILFSYGHRPDRCMRCRGALEMMTDHDDVVTPGLPTRT